MDCQRQFLFFFFQVFSVEKKFEVVGSKLNVNNFFLFADVIATNMQSLTCSYIYSGKI